MRRLSMTRLAAWLKRSARSRPCPPAQVDPRAARVARLWQLGEATASLSHDLGQPLNIIRLTAEATLDALEHGRADPERIRRSLRAGIEQTARMQAMIDTLLAGTRRPRTAPGPVETAQAVSRALEALRERLEQGGIRVQTAIDPSTPKVQGHAARLEMAVSQILLNACEALSAAALAPDALAGVLRVGCRGDGGDVVLSVEDNGPGFPPALLASLDAPLPETGGKRTGIGLTIALGVAAEMGGAITIADAHPGTRVEIRLPAATPCRTVLLARDEDQDEAARDMAEYLTSQGWRVHMAKGGNPALALCDQCRPDAVVADLRMADGDGWTLIAALRARAPDLPIIAVTAAPGEDARRAVEAGAVLVLAQPVGLEDLARELDELL